MLFLILVEDIGIYQADNQEIFFSDCCDASEDLSNSIQFEPLKVLDFLREKKAFVYGNAMQSSFLFFALRGQLHLALASTTVEFVKLFRVAS